MEMGEPSFCSREKDGNPMEEMENHILILTVNDLKQGPRSLKKLWFGRPGIGVRANFYQA